MKIINSLYNNKTLELFTSLIDRLVLFLTALIGAPADESQSVCPIDFDYGNRTSDFDRTETAFTITPQLLWPTVIIAIPVTGYLVKKVYAYLSRQNAVSRSDEKQLAKPAAIMQLLVDLHLKVYEDWKGSLPFAIMMGPTLAAIILGYVESYLKSSLEPGLSYESDEELNAKLENKLFLIFAGTTVVITNFSFAFLFNQIDKKKKALSQKIAHHATEMTLKELQEYKKPGLLASVNQLLAIPATVIFYFVLSRLQYFPKIFFLTLFQYAWIPLTYKAIDQFAYYANLETGNKIEAMVKSYKKALQLAKCHSIEVKKDEHNTLILKALDRLAGLPRHILFGEMISFSRKNFGDNPLYFDTEKYQIQIIPTDTQVFKNNAWKIFFEQINEMKGRKKDFQEFAKRGQLFFLEHFHIERAIKLMPHYDEIEKTNFTLQLNITPLNEEKQEIIAEIFREKLQADVANLFGILSIGPIEEVQRHQFRKIGEKICEKLQLKKEFKAEAKTETLISNNEFHYFNPPHFYWKPKKSKFKQNVVEEKQTNLVINREVDQKVIYFDDTFGSYDASDAKCLIKSFPLKNKSNIFITMHPDLREELKGTDQEKDIAWFTENFDETKHKEPRIEKTNEKINASGAIPRFKVYLSGEKRATCNQWGQVRQNNKTYTLFIVDEYNGKLHNRTSHASHSSHSTAGKRQKINFDL